MVAAHKRIQNPQKPTCICIIWFCLLVFLSHHGRASSSSTLTSTSSSFNLSLPHQHPFPEHVVLNVQRYNFSSIFLILNSSSFNLLKSILEWVLRLLSKTLCFSSNGVSSVSFPYFNILCYQMQETQRFYLQKKPPHLPTRRRHDGVGAITFLYHREPNRRLLALRPKLVGKSPTARRLLDRLRTRYARR